MTASTNVAIDLNHRRHRPWSRSKYGARLQSPILPGSKRGHLLQSPVYRGWRGTKEVTGVRTPHKVGYHGPLTVAVLAFVETPKNVSEGSGGGSIFEIWAQKAVFSTLLGPNLKNPTP